jgi:hypothetical protein
MKNIAHSFILIFLFAILCPSYQAYAEGKEASNRCQKEYNKKLLIKELGHSLSTDKVFEQLFYNLAALQFINEVNYIGLPEIEKNAMTSKIDLLIANDGNVSENEFKTTSDLMNFQNTTDAEAYTKSILASLVFLKMKYFDFYDLDKYALQQANEIAINEGNLVEKFNTKIIESKEECFERIKRGYDNCLTAGSWYKYAMLGASFICYVTMIALTIASFSILIANAEILVPYLTGIYEAAIAAGEASAAAEGSALGYVRVTIVAIRDAIGSNITTQAFQSLLRAGLRCVLGVFAYICGERTMSYFGGSYENMVNCFTTYKNSSTVCMGLDGAIANMGAVPER